MTLFNFAPPRGDGTPRHLTAIWPRHTSRRPRRSTWQNVDGHFWILDRSTENCEEASRCLPSMRGRSPPQRNGAALLLVDEGLEYAIIGSVLTRVRLRPLASLITLLFVVLSCPSEMQAYSVLAHEALIDAVWEPLIVPVLLKRYPRATGNLLRQAHAYAYGGSVIQDMGYYPFSSDRFSRLTHYVRTGDFIRALLDDSRDILEYAFALGALSHYVADNVGHALAVNLAVPDMYPDLQRKYGNRVTFEDDPGAHVMVEFSFDVAQIAGAGFLPRTYHNYLGFKVKRSLLERAFRQTYGLRLSQVVPWEALSFKVYRFGASTIVPALAQVVWRQEKRKIQRLDPTSVPPNFSYRLSPENYKRLPDNRRVPLASLRPWRWRWAATATHESIGWLASAAVYVIRVLPKIGPLHTLRFKPPTLQVQAMFISSFDVTVQRYGADLFDLESGSSPTLPDRNLDTGKEAAFGDYNLADRTYADLLDRLAKQHFRNMSQALRLNILAYFHGFESTKEFAQHIERWLKVAGEIAELRVAQQESSLK